MSRVLLQSVDITGDIWDNFARIHVKSVYFNSFGCTIESIYRFCLESAAVVDSFTARINEREIVGVVQEKAQARVTYVKAVNSNKRTSLLEKNEDQYSVRIGNFAANEAIVISYSYITKLKVGKDGRLIFAYPTNVGERYGMFVEQTSNPSFPTTSQSLSTGGGPGHTFYFSISCRSNSGLRRVYSLTHSQDVNVALHPHEAVVTMLSMPKGGDFNLILETENASSLYSGVFEGDCYMLLTQKVDNEPADAICREYLFILDRSGSMEGEKMADAKAALKQSIELLQENACFNVISFGDDFTAMFNRSVTASPANKQKATSILQSYGADMGGTEIYNCLQACLISNFNKFQFTSSDTVRPKKQETVLVFLTDGQICSQNEIYEMIKRYEKVRIFSIGIGRDASRDFIENIAAMTGGLSEMVIDSANVSDVATAMVSNTHHKYYKNVSIRVNGEIVSFVGQNVLYPGNYFTALAKVPGLTIDAATVLIEGYYNDAVREWRAIAAGAEAMDPAVLAKLYANELIKEGRLSDQQVVELSVKHNIMNQLTSFVMVDHDARVEEKQSATMEVPQHQRSSSPPLAVGGLAARRMPASTSSSVGRVVAASPPSSCCDSCFTKECVEEEEGEYDDACDLFGDSCIDEEFACERAEAEECAVDLCMAAPAMCSAPPPPPAPMMMKCTAPMPAAARFQNFTYTAGPSLSSIGGRGGGDEGFGCGAGAPEVAVEGDVAYDIFKFANADGSFKYDEESSDIVIASESDVKRLAKEFAVDFNVLFHVMILIQLRMMVQTRAVLNFKAALTTWLSTIWPQYTGAISKLEIFVRSP